MSSFSMENKENILDIIVSAFCKWLLIYWGTVSITATIHITPITSQITGATFQNQNRVIVLMDYAPITDQMYAYDHMWPPGWYYIFPRVMQMFLTKINKHVQQNLMFSMRTNGWPLIPVKGFVAEKSWLKCVGTNWSLNS